MTARSVHPGVDRSWRSSALAEGEQAAVWVDALSGDWQAGAKLVKGAGDGSTVEVWFADFGAHDVVIKLWPLRSLKRRLQAIFRTTPACRHWHGARWLLEHEIPTAEPLARLHTVGAPHYEALVMRRLPGRTLLEWMADRTVPVQRQHELARIVGRSAARLLHVGYNRDHKPSNLIVIESAGGPIDLAVVDCVAIRPGPVELEQDAESELAMLVIEPLGCGVMPRRSLQMRALGAYCKHRLELLDSSGDSHRLRRTLWRGVRETIESHGDPTPRDNPLAARSR